MLDLAYLASTFLIGLYAGSLLVEAMILVPYWRKIPAAQFFALHGTLGPNLFRYFAPLTTLAVLFAIAVPILNRAESLAWILSGILSAGALVIFFIYFKKANQSFADHTLSEADLPAELARWARWHWLRTVMIMGALGASIYGHAV